MNAKNKQRVLLLVGLSLLGALSWRVCQRQAEIERVLARLNAAPRPFASPSVAESSEALTNKLPTHAIRSGLASVSGTTSRTAAFQEMLDALKVAAVPPEDEPRLLPPTRMWIVLQELMADPDYARLDAFRREWQARINLNEQLGGLELNAAERAKLAEAFIAFDASMSDLRSLQAENGLTSEATSRSVRKALMRMRVNLHQEFDAELRAVLGPEKYAQYRQRPSHVRLTIVGLLEQRLSYSPDPLSETQVAKLTELLTALPLERGASPRLETLTDDAIAKAQAMLRPEQGKALAQLRVEAQAIKRMSEILGRPAVAAGW